MKKKYAKKIFEKAIAEIFNLEYKNHDNVDRTVIYNYLASQELKTFYFLVTLKTIEFYLHYLKKKLK